MKNGLHIVITSSQFFKSRKIGLKQIINKARYSNPVSGIFINDYTSLDNVVFMTISLTT